MAGTLTGQVFKSIDTQVQRQLEDWKQFFPIEPRYSCREPGGEEVAMPPAVEVAVGGMKMRYPTCYVLVTDMDDPSAAPNHGLLGISPAAAADVVLKSVTIPAVATPPCSPMVQGNNRTSSHHPASMQNSPSPATSLPEHVWQDNALNPTQHEPSSEHQENLPQWEFADPTRKTICTCSKYVIENVCISQFWFQYPTRLHLCVCFIFNTNLLCVIHFLLICM